jgi:hypothetical protein
MKVAPLLEPASSPALFSADDRIGPTSERPAALNTAALDSRVGLAIRSPTLSVHTIPVPIEPIPRRSPMTLPATRRPAEMHMPVVRELLERKPPGASGATLLGDRLNHSRQVVV